jgi:hypothetical protein
MFTNENLLTISEQLNTCIVCLAAPSLGQVQPESC